MPEDKGKRTKSKLNASLATTLREYANVIVLVLVMWVLGLVLGIGWQSSGTIAGILAIAVAGLEVLWGLGGQALLGQNGFIAIGAYTVALLTTKAHFPSLVALLIAGPFAALAGAGIWVLIRKLGELYFAIATLGFGLLIPSLAVALTGITGGDSGIAGIPPLGIGNLLNPDILYNVVWVLAGVCAIFVLRIKRSPMGIALETMRSDGLVASACGIDTSRLRRTSFLYSVAIAGWAGGLYAFSFLAITPGDFGFTLALELFAMQVLGGLGSGYGAIIGAAAVGLFTMGTSQHGSYSGVLYGGVFIATLLVAPQGIVGLWRASISRVKHHVLSRRTSSKVLASRVSGRTQDFPQLGTVVVQGLEIWKIFGGVIANKSIDIEVTAGSVTGLIGANGAGKSTLLNVLSGRMAPDLGSVAIRGIPVEKRTMAEVAQSGVARTFQVPRWIPRMSVRENVASGAYRFHIKSGLLSALGFSGKKRYYQMLDEAERVLDRLDAHSLADESADSLSFGQIRLLELARALALDPQVLLLDEPLSGLDDEEKARVGALLRELAAEGMAIVFVEHDTEAVREFCDTVFVMDFGEIIAVASADDVFNLDVVRKSYLGDEVGAVPLGEEEQTVESVNAQKFARVNLPHSIDETQSKES